jgi:two-component system chemotaxis sensor kinase CheA
MEFEKYQKIFIQESSKYLEELDTVLMEVEKNLQDQQLWGEIHGKIHSVKGDGQSAQHDGSGSFCHAMESWCKLFQEG